MGVDESTDIRVAVLVFPFAAPNTYSFAHKLLTVMSYAAAYTVLISGGIPSDIVWPDGVRIYDINVRMHRLKDKKPTWFSAALWIAKAVLVQVRFAMQILCLRNEIDAVFCTLGLYYQLPIFAARMLGKKVLCASLGNDVERVKMNYGSSLAPVTGFLRWLNFSLSHAVMIESDRLVEQDNLVPFRSKTCNGALFLDDLERFRVQTGIRERENLVGFIGRLVPEKGVSQFLQAIPLALEREPSLRFLIVGTGSMDDAVKGAVEKNALSVTWLKWVDHEDISECLNRLTLLVVPSYIEGLPNLVLEAMGCGTPVLASKAGGIPDLVIDSETGFLLSDNSPDAISEAIVRIVNDPHLEVIAQQARALLERDYSLETARDRYKSLLNFTMGGNGSCEFVR